LVYSEEHVGSGNFVRRGGVKSDLPPSFFSAELLRVCGKFLESALVQVRVESLGPCPAPAYGVGILGENGGMSFVNFQNCEAPSISVEIMD
jgi:hypothetical protein